MTTTTTTTQREPAPAVGSIGTSHRLRAAAASRRYV
jgi:hypothetical protein